MPNIEEKTPELYKKQMHGDQSCSKKIIGKQVFA